MPRKPCGEFGESHREALQGFRRGSGDTDPAPSRSTTPKSPIFPNLDQAHQAIAGHFRSLRTNAAELPGVPSVDPAINSGGLVDTALTMTGRNPADQMKSASDSGPGPTKPAAGDLPGANPDQPRFSPEPVSVHDPARAPLSPLAAPASGVSATDDGDVEGALPPLVPHGTGGTVEKIYGQHAAASSSSGFNPAVVYSTTPAADGTDGPYGPTSEPFQREGAVARCGFRDHDKPDSPAMGNNRDSLASQGAFSLGGVTTDTEEGGPFRYDKNYQPLFLQPSKEREVSVALRHVDCVSTAHSQGTLCSADGTPIHQTLRPPVPPLPTQEAMQQLAERHTQKAEPPQNSGFYQSPGVQPPLEMEKSGFQVKIPIRAAAVTSGQAARKRATTAGLHFDNTRPTRPSPYNATAGDMMSDGDDWETVATSVGVPNSNRGYSLNPYAVAVGGYGAKITGSSIADYSDEQSMHMGGTYDAFSSSTDRIIQHRPAQSVPGPSNPRNLIQAGRPNFPPQQRTHRVNGYPENPGRIPTDQTEDSAGVSSKDSFVDKLPQAFRPNGMRNRPTALGNKYKSLGMASKFDFRDSAGSDGQEERLIVAHAREDPKGKGKAKEEAPPRPQQSRYAMTNLSFPTSPLPPPWAADRWGAPPPVGRSSDGFSDLSSPTQFSFPLIPLPEAARLQARRRELGEDDQTFIENTGTKKLGGSSSKSATPGTGSSGTPISELVKAHIRKAAAMEAPLRRFSQGLFTRRTGL